MKAARLLLISAALMVTAAWLSAGTADASRARASRQVVFYADVANVVPGSPPFQNVPTVRPRMVLLIQDGSSVLEKLRWSSWGGRLARAKGILSASNCVPDCAQGKRTTERVKFVLSQRRRLFGRTVYTCYQLTDPKAPQIYHDCLKHYRGNQYDYVPVAGRHSVAARGCSNQTVTVLEAKPVAITLRFVLHHVSCRKAHSLIRTYFRHQARPGYCLKHGNICAFVSGGWTCSLPLYAGEGGGYFAACIRESPFRQVKVFTVTRGASAAAELSSTATTGDLTGVAATSAAAKRSCGTERVVPGTIGPAKTGSTSGPGIPYKIIVWRGSVSCRKARSLIKATGQGKGAWHEAPDLAGIYTSFPGGWRCAPVTGGDYGCSRGRRIGATGHADEIDGIQL